MANKTEYKKMKQNERVTLKKQFFASDIPVVKDFMNARGYSWDKTTETYTNWWFTEKQEMLDKITELAKDKIIKDSVDEYIVPVEDLYAMKKTTVELLKAKLNELGFRAKEWVEYIKWKRDKNPKKWKREWYKPDEVKSSEVIEIMNAVKRELWEPLTISKIHSTIDMNEKLSDEEAEIIEMIDTMEALEDWKE